LLQRAGKTGVVDRSADQRRIRSILKEPDSAADHRARTAYRAGKACHLRRSAVRPRETEARAHVDVIGRAIVPLAEYAFQLGIVGRLRREMISVETDAELDLDVVTLLVRVSKRHPADELAPASHPRRELTTERRRLLRLQIGERGVAECAKGVVLLVQRECIAA